MSHVRKDFTGHIFGNLTAIEFARFEIFKTAAGATQRISHWKFACICGSEKVMRINSVTSGNASSCGCLKGRHRRLDIVGRRFGKLVAVRAVGNVKRRGIEWLCRCDCGSDTQLEVGKLTGGHTKSCGCAQYRPPIYTSKAMAARAMKVRRRERRIRNGGSFTEKQIAALHKLQRGRCAGCAVLLRNKFHRDHRLPVMLGGSSDISNIQLLCGPCNRDKHAMHPIAWAQKRGMLL